MVVRVLLFVVAAAVITSCAATPPDPTALRPEVVKSVHRYTKEYILQPGDQLEVSIFHVPDLSRTVTVRPDGFVSLPALKDVKAGGLTVPEFDDDLTRRYTARLVNPDVTVNVANPRAASVFVMGEVVHAGAVPVRDAPNVAMAIAQSGGVARSAALDNVAVIRMDENGYLTGSIVERKNSGETAFYMAMTNMALQAGDVVVVPESGRSQFTRFIQDFVNLPLTAVNQGLSPYYEFKLLDLITPASSTGAAAGSVAAH